MVDVLWSTKASLPPRHTWKDNPDVKPGLETAGVAISMLVLAQDNLSLNLYLAV